MPTTDWPVAVADVGALLRARTVDDTGHEVGTFTQHTRPTDVQVSAILSGSVSSLAVDVGVDIPQSLWGAAARAITLDAAMMVELTYFPESVNREDSAFNRLKQLRDERWLSLVKAAEDALAEGEGSDAVGGSPSYAFPANEGGMVGWGTRW